jgi:hypothetical protein
MNQTLYKKPLYNAVTDFAPVGIFQRYFLALIARKDLPANTLPEFIAYAKTNQAKMQYASSGTGSNTHIACGRTKMFGTSDRTKTKYPAEPQKPGRTGQHATKSAQSRTGAKVRSGVVDEAGDMGGSRAANPRRPAA